MKGYKLPVRVQFNKKNMFKFKIGYGIHPVQKDYSAFKCWVKPEGRHSARHYNFNKFVGSYQYF